MSRSFFGKMRLVIQDFVALRRVCGLSVAARWLAAVLSHARIASRSGNLQSADRSLGSGPFVIAHPACTTRFSVFGDGVVSGIREIFARDCYFKGRRGLIRDGDIVVDLGANLGNFTNLALAHGTSVRVVALEPSRLMNERFERSVSSNNGFRQRVKLIRGFLGEATPKQARILAEQSEYGDAPWLSESQFFAEAGIDHIDFLKCDIEGGEFSILHTSGPFLAMSHTVAVEIHSFAGPVDMVVERLTGSGFTVLSRDNHSDGSCVLLARKGGRPAAGGGDRAFG